MYIKTWYNSKSQRAKCFNSHRPKYVPGGKTFQCLHNVYYWSIVNIKISNKLQYHPGTHKLSLETRNSCYMILLRCFIWLSANLIASFFKHLQSCTISFKYFAHDRRFKIKIVKVSSETAFLSIVENKQ